MLIKKSILAILLNIIFGGVGYLYINERKVLGVFLIAVTAYELIRNIIILSGSEPYIDPYALHTLPMLSLFSSVAGVIILAIMAIDIYFLVRRQISKSDNQKLINIKAA